MAREFAIQVVQKLTDAGYLAYWAGGCVRDLLRGVEPHDFDVATNATPDQVRNVFGRYRTLAVGESFGVVIVLNHNRQDKIEVATFRTDSTYSDGRHPDEVAFSTAEEDAQRRDFTVNGMFFDPLTATVHDFVGGQADLKARVVRAIGDPRARMTEDKLRLLRAVRFAAVLDFQLEPATAEAVSEMASQVLVVSAERIAQELRKMLVSPHRARAMQLCAELNLLQFILPEVNTGAPAGSDDRWKLILQALSLLGDASFPAALAAVLNDVPMVEEDTSRHAPEQHGTVLAACRRLKLSNQEREQVGWLASQRGAIKRLPDESLATVKRLLAHPLFPELLHLRRAFVELEGKDQSAFQWVDEFLARTPPEEINPPELIRGKDLLEMRLKAGPEFKVWLNAVRDAQLNGEIVTRADAIRLVRTLSWR